MSAQKRDPLEAECRKQLRPLADALARAGPERRQEVAATMLAEALPTPLRVLAELLVERLDYADEDVCAGAAAALAALCPRALPTIEWALVDKPSEQRLLYLAAVAVAVGRSLSDKERRSLQGTLLVAVGFARTIGCRVAVDDAVWQLRGHETVELELEGREPDPFARPGA